MKLANLFLITGLVSVLAAIGCASDPQPQNGGGGSGGNGTTDPCTGGQCADQTVKERCEEGVAYCKSLGAGGAGGAPTEDQCDAAGSGFCNIDTGAGGEGGSGGTPGNCDFTVEQVCNVNTCDADDRVGACTSRFEDCLANPPDGNFCEKCAVAAIETCGAL